MIVLATLAWIFPFRAMASGDENPDRVRLTAASPPNNPGLSEFKPAQDVFNPESGSIAWAHNAWTLEIYNLNIDTPDISNVTDTVDFQTFCGDFAPGDSLRMWVIQYPENKLRTINILTGETTLMADLPVPLVNGIWTSLIVEKTTGAFYAIATDGVGSVLYSVDPLTGTTEELFELGLNAVISSAFDATGNLYIFDIEGDSTFVVDISMNEVNPLGPAGFDGNYAQGMGCDPNTDEIYLAAFDAEQGPQLRKLNKLTGETTLITAIPGETGAFGFPVGNAGLQVSAGADETICENQAFVTVLATASGYYALEWSASGDGTFDDSGLLQAVYHPGVNDILGGSVELCLTATGADGTALADCLMLTILHLPQADAGPDNTISSGDDFQFSDAAAMYYNTLFWTSSGDGTFSDTSLLLPVYTPGPDDLNKGMAELCLTAAAAAPCATVANSCMILSIEEIPEGIDFGDAPENTGNPLSFPTTLAQNGAAHSIDPSIYLGQKIDGEPDGQPEPAALGDDQDLLYPSFGDDEDGVEMPAYIYQGTEVNITITASTDGYLDAWIDFNQDQAWLNPSEHIFSMVPLASGNNVRSFIVPPAAVPGQSFIRFRFRDYPQPLDAGGFAYNGEVEDYAVEIRESQVEEMDYGDAPSNGNTSYPTLFAENGARHYLVEGVHLGNAVDAEPDGQPYSGAMGDDQDIYFPSLGDDEDGVILPETVQTGSEAGIEVYASVDGFLDAWMDFNRDGNWSNDEHIFAVLPVNAGLNSLQISVPDDAMIGQSFLRFRFRDYAEPLEPTGAAQNGEVEDYAIQVAGAQAPLFDFGDAPGVPGLYSYPTLKDDEGARHKFVPGIYLGEFVDAEPDGQPSPDAMGDDYDQYYPSDGDDEDGILFQGQLKTGATVNVSVAASVNGFLEAWIDFNRDGDWDDNGEHIFGSQALVQGNNTLAFDVPENAVTGTSFARFRFSDYDAKPGPSGVAENGEVEDYMILIRENIQGGFDFGDVPDSGYPVLLGDDGARHLVDGVTFLGTVIDAENDGLPAGDAKGDDMDNQDDEDGVIFSNRFFVGSSAYLKVSVSTTGYLNAWADFNQNSSWSDADEKVFDALELSAGDHNLEIELPESVNTGDCFMRFRFSSEPDLSFTGEAANGEVEDYKATIFPAWNNTPTPVTHIIMIPGNLSIVNSGDMLSVFFADDGLLKPAGNTVYQSGQPGQLIAWGDDPSTPDEIEGFVSGDTLHWKLFKAATGEVNDVRVEYDPLFPDHNGTFSPMGLSAVTEIQYLENPCPIPPGWEFLVTGLVHSINIPVDTHPAILTEELEQGDWIGAFYKNDDDALACGGTAPWMEESGIVLNIYGDDPFTDEKDGFAAGEPITWKIYRCADGQIFEAAASYNPALPCVGYFGDFCLSELSSLQGMYFRHYLLNQGWNSISSYLVPAEPDVESIFADHSDELIIVKNLETIYWPYAGVNTIVDWDNYSGYAIKLAAGIDLKIGGEMFANNEVTLDAGWHYLPVLSDCPVDAAEIFEPVVDKITIVQDLIGTQVWWPDQNIFTLQSVMPGRAYKIRLTDVTTIAYPPCDGDNMPKAQSKSSAEISTSPVSAPTPYSHTVSFLRQAMADLPSGKYIGAFDKLGNLFGVIKIENNNHNQAMVLKGDDPVTPVKEGFSEGEALAFALLDGDLQSIAELNAIYENMYGFTDRYADNGLSVVKYFNRLPQDRMQVFPEIEVFPNPSTGIFNIFGLDRIAEYGLYDLFGNLLQSGKISPNGEINLSQRVEGVYYLRINTGTTDIYKRLILK